MVIGFDAIPAWLVSMVICIGLGMTGARGGCRCRVDEGREWLQGLRGRRYGCKGGNGSGWMWRLFYKRRQTHPGDDKTDGQQGFFKEAERMVEVTCEAAYSLEEAVFAAGQGQGMCRGAGEPGFAGQQGPDIIHLVIRLSKGQVVAAVLPLGP